jgi:AcrR family transcriptional regulator
MESRKQEILLTAAALFRHKGYSAVTMRDLASELGIKAASLYNHISSKQEILEEIILNIAKDFTAGMKEITSEPSSSIQKLTKIVYLHAELAVKNPNGMSALNSDWMHLEEHLDEYLRLRDTYESNFRSIIKIGIAVGEIKNKDVNLIVFSMLSTLRSLYLWIPKKNVKNLEAFSEELADILIKGINT